MKRYLFLLLSSILSIGGLYAQSGPASVIIKVGYDNYNGSFGNFGGGGGSDDYWNIGYIAAAGIEIPMTGILSFQGMASFAVHDYDMDNAWSEKFNNAKNYIASISGNLKFNIKFFYYRFGIGLSSMKEDAVYYFFPNHFHKAMQIQHPAQSEIRIMGLLGTGFQYDISRKISLFIELNANIRHYLGGSFCLGISHKL